MQTFFNLSACLDLKTFIKFYALTLCGRTGVFMRINSKYLIKLAIFALIGSLCVLFATSCGSQKNTIVDGLEYILLDSGDAYEVYGIGDHTGGELTVPAEIRGLPVRGIGASAFAGNKTVKNLKISNGISYIGEGAFSDCDSLESISLPATLTKIDDRAFEDCGNLFSMDLGGVLHIGDYAFSKCIGLHEAELPADLQALGDYAFFDAWNLEKINISAGLTEIGAFTFAGCRNLPSVNLHDGITKIGESAFKDCLELSEVWIGFNVSEIGIHAFQGCEALSYAHFKNYDGWNVDSDSTPFSNNSLTDPSYSAMCLSSRYDESVWQRKN